MEKKRNRNKIFISICTFIVVVFAFVGITLSFPHKKVKAGVIIDTTYNMVAYGTIIDASNFNNRYIGINYITLSPSYTSSIWGQSIAQVYTGDTLNGFIQLRNIDGVVGQYPSIERGQVRAELIFNKTNSAALIPTIASAYYIADIITIDNGNVYLIIDTISLFQQFYNYDATFNIRTSSISNFFARQNTIASVQNIYDLENNTLTLLYFSDLSGLSTSTMRDEITINWGYIDTNDNTIYAVYAPTISAQNMQTNDKIIRLGMPSNAVGDAMQYYDISQQALLSITGLDTGSATATANIYGVYVWRNENNIKWGLVNFNTSITPASALNMNYITSYTELFDYQNTNTFTMTCRLSVSNNFNFITIKNQTSVNIDAINEVIRNGGFLPAWALYNWARGTYSGYVAGAQAGAAAFQPGNAGYQEIFDAGYLAGFDAAEIGTGAWFITAFNAVDRFLNIRIFPNITFGVLLGIPFVISVVWFIIRMFRGGGGGD